MDTNKIESYKEIINNLTLGPQKKREIEIQWLQFVTLMEDLTNINYVRYNILNITSIVCSLSVPVFVTYADNHIFKVLTAALGLIGGIFATLNQSYKFNDKWKHFRRISEEVKIEGANYFAQSSNYTTSVNHEESYKLFMGRLNSIKNQQIEEYINKVMNTLTPTDETGTKPN